MRKLALTVALAATATLAAPLVQPAEAGVIKPAGIGAALDQTRLAEPVHCRPGRWHHSSRSRPDGCRQSVQGGYYYGYQPYYAAPAPAPYPYPYAYGYSPGISLGFHFGSRRHHSW